jgi:phenylacetate-CoA ligase
LDNFSHIPPLTKDIIRAQGASLYSDDRLKRKVRENASGGSTGEPICLLQDRCYRDWNTAHKMYFNLMQDVDFPARQIKLWGSERDIFVGRERLSTRLQYWLFNITNLNSFRMSDAIMERYCRQWNLYRPTLVWTYTSSIHEFGKYLKRTGAAVCPPEAIICTAETLEEPVRQFLRETFHCPIINQYGSREVGAMACECRAGGVLHVFCLHNKIEILDDHLCPCQPGQIGDVYVTNLNNYAMPLIRYRIGDMAVSAAQHACSCHRAWPSLQKISGRRSDHFRTQDGKIIHGEYFTHLFYHQPGIRQFQVIQRDCDFVEILTVSQDALEPGWIREIEQKIKLVMGEACTVKFTRVSHIQASASGKFRFTISEVG